MAGEEGGGVAGAGEVAEEEGAELGRDGGPAEAQQLGPGGEKFGHLEIQGTRNQKKLKDNRNCDLCG